MHKDDSFNPHSMILLDLLYLKQTNYPAFMERLFEALTGEFKNVIHDSAPAEEKRQAIQTMIAYFSGLEQYEKCSILKKLEAEILAKESSGMVQ